MTTLDHRTGSIEWTGDNLAEILRFVSTHCQYDRHGLPRHDGDLFRVTEDGTGSLWAASEGTWIDVPVGHRIYRSATGLWTLSPRAVAATVDPVVAAVMAPVDRVQTAGRRLRSLLRRPGRASL
ncbi:hypothetical protein ACFQ6Q_00620 [Streptomyces sp. NPDC056437]|uniref:hypothetical protein n=1 Tax=Streptomyces sp. NPDC056437 TaxID=3345816 RepID=UPI0036B7C8F2